MHEQEPLVPEPGLRLLVCTNGEASTRPALAYGVWLAELLKLPVTLLGVVEPHRQPARKVERLLQETAVELKQRNLSYELLLEKGRGTPVIARHACGQAYVTIVGPLGRPLWRRVVQGRSFRRLLARIETPILYVPQLRLPLRKVLVCLGGLGYADSVVQFCILLAAAAQAQLTLLHVVEPITLDYPTSQAIHEHMGEEILKTETPQARNLQRALQEAELAGLPVELKVRQGNVVHEIQVEVEAGDYDLIGMGSPHSSQSLRALYLPNVTAEIAESLDRPVVTVRLGHELLLDVGND